MDLMDDRPYKAYAIMPLLVRYWKVFLVVAVVAGTLAIAISLTMPKQYKALAVLFPPHATDLEQAISNPQFGYDVAADRLIQLLESRQLRDLVVQETGLVDYYDSDTTKPGWKQRLEKKYFKDVSFERTRYMSVVITATFKNPVLAAEVVNANIDKVDQVRKKVFHASLKEQSESLQKAVSEQRDKVTSLGDSLLSIGQDPGREGISWLYTRLRFRGEQIMERDAVTELLNEQPTQLLDPRNELLAMDYVLALQRLEHMQGQLARLSEFLQQPMPGVYVVDRAEPAHDPSGPSLLRNALIAIVGGLLITLTLLLIRERMAQLAKRGE